MCFVRVRERRRWRRRVWWVEWALSEKKDFWRSCLDLRFVRIWGFKYFFGLESFQIFRLSFLSLFSTLEPIVMKDLSTFLIFSTLFFQNTNLLLKTHFLRLIFNALTNFFLAFNPHTQISFFRFFCSLILSSISLVCLSRTCSSVCSQLLTLSPETQSLNFSTALKSSYCLWLIVHLFRASFLSLHHFNA